MLKHYTTLLLFSLFSWSLAAQCPAGDVTLLSQSDVNTYVATYPNCPIINGDLKIGNGSSSTNTNDLSGLSNIHTVHGDVSIFFNGNLNTLAGLHGLVTVDGTVFIWRNNALSSLSGLEGLTQVGDGFSLFRNDNLTSLDGPESLTHVAGDLTIRQNALLTDLTGLETLTSVDELVNIRDNASLTMLDGLHNLAYLDIDVLNITGNPQLSNCAIDNFCMYLGMGTNLATVQFNAPGCDTRAEVITSCASDPDCPPGDVLLLSQAEVDAFVAQYPNCTTINGTLRFGDNSTSTDINDISGLSFINTVLGDLSFFFNDNLTSLQGLQSITTLSGALAIFRNNGLTDLSGLEGLGMIGGEISLFRNENLTNLSGLEGVTSAGGGLTIRQNAVLTDLSSLQGLSSISGILNIRENSILTSLSGLDNIDPAGIGSLNITNNPVLTLCAIENVCTYLETPTNFANINGNSTDCNTRPVLEDVCNRCPDGNVTFLTQAEVDAFVAEYPNCKTISGNLRVGEGNSSTDISDLSGLNSLRTITGLFAVFYNDNLNSLTGLEALTTVGDGVYIFRNNSISSMAGLESLATIGGKLHIFRNNNMTNLSGLDALTSVGAELRIRNNAGLVNLDGLDQLSSVGGFLAIFFNNSLSNIDGLSSVTSIGSFLAIRQNSALTDIGGIVNIPPADIDNLYITENPSLSDCAIDNICTYLTTGNNPALIEKNFGPCDSRMELEEECNTMGLAAMINYGTQAANATESAEKVNENAVASIKLYPNPTSGLLQLRNVEVQEVTVISPQGQRMAHYIAPGTELDMSALPAGVYYLNFLTADGRQTERVVKVD